MRRVLQAARVIDAAFAVSNPAIKILATPHDAFTRQARRYLEQAVFARGRVRNRPVCICINMPVDFKIRGWP